jgi:hypothetical protein
MCFVQHFLNSLKSLQVPERKFWQDSSVFAVSDFIKAVESGEIESKQQEARQKNQFEEFVDRFVAYLPWSLLGMLAMFGGAFYLFLPGSNTVVRPTTPPYQDLKDKIEAAKKRDDPTSKKDR